VGIKIDWKSQNRLVVLVFWEKALESKTFQLQFFGKKGINKFQNSRECLVLGFFWMIFRIKEPPVRTVFWNWLVVFMK